MEGVSGAFVGRARELEELRAVLEDAVAGRGRLVLIAGEPGIGKSRLAEQLAATARTEGVTVLWGRCWEAGGAPPYWPWVQSLRSIIRGIGADAVRDVVGTGASYVGQMLPEIADPLDQHQQPSSLDPDAARFALFDATAEMIRAIARSDPLMFVLEDLHAADTPSLLMLEFVARVLGDARVLVIGTYRDVELPRAEQLASTLVELRRLNFTRLVSLRGLDIEDVARFVEQTAGVVPSDAIIQVLARETEGNPLFVGEITRLLVSEGRLEAVADAAELKPLPQGIKDVIGRRLDHLSERCNHVLSIASVLGRDFGLDVLARLSERPADELLEILDESIDARVTASVPGTVGTMRFSHSLIRDTFYDELSSSRRLRLHRRAGEIFEEMYGGSGERLNEIAHHYSMAAPGGAADHAVRFARAAGDRAAAQLAYEEAERLYRMALGSMAFRQDRDHRERCELLLALGDATARAGDLAEAQSAFAEAAAVAEEEALPEHLARAALGYGGRFVWPKEASVPGLVALLERALALVGDDPTPLRSRLLARLAGALRDRPEREPRESLSEEAVAIARSLGDQSALAWALDARFASIWYPGNAEERLGIATELLEVAQDSRDPERIASGHTWRWAALLELGDFAGARAEQRTLGRLAGELRQGAHRWLEEALAAGMALFEGRFDEAEDLAERAMKVGTRAQTFDAGVAHMMQRTLLARDRGGLEALEPALRGAAERFRVYPMFRCALTLLLAELGREDEARRTMRELTAHDLGGLPLDSSWLFGVSLLAEAAALLDDAEAAALLYERLAPYEPFNLVAPAEAIAGSVSRPLGSLAATLGRYDDALRHLERAVEENSRMGGVPWTARSQLELARVCQLRDAPGDRERASSLVAAALGTARALGMTSVEAAAGALLGDRPIEVAPPADGPADGVFRREGEYFTIAWGDDGFRLKDSKGLRYLAFLLGSPGREHHAMELVAAVEGVAAPSPARVEAGVLTGAGGAGDELLDATARAAYRARVADLEAEIEEASAFGDDERAARAREELDVLLGELTSSLGLGGRSRRTGSDAERARVNVTRAIRSALGRITAESSALGAHLEATVATGTFCVYTPDPRVPVAWVLS